MRKRKIADEGLRLAVEAVGTRYRLAKMLNLTPTSVQEWKQIPLQRVKQVEAITNIPREKLRPDFFDR
jgi:DNA-binding transcriptional regulator YdaS (Cro superfamily)